MWKLTVLQLAWNAKSTSNMPIATRRLNVMYADFGVTQRLLAITLSDDFHCQVCSERMAFSFKRGDILVLTVPLK